MTPLERLRTVPAALNLTAIDLWLETLLEEGTVIRRVLIQVRSTESEARPQCHLKTRLQPAHLSYIKDFDQFDFGLQPSIDERQIR
jgi:hypothetical protein